MYRYDHISIGADICSRQGLYIFVHIATVDVKAMGVWFIDQTPVQAAHRTACNIVIVFSIEDLGFGTYFVILL